MSAEKSKLDQFLMSEHSKLQSRLLPWTQPALDSLEQKKPSVTYHWSMLSRFYSQTFIPPLVRKLKMSFDRHSTRILTVVSQNGEGAVTQQPEMWEREADGLDLTDDPTGPFSRRPMKPVGTLFIESISADSPFHMRMLRHYLKWYKKEAKKSGLNPDEAIWLL